MSVATGSVLLSFLFYALGTILTKSRCVAAVIQDATSKPYTMNIIMKYWEGTRREQRVRMGISPRDCIFI